ncbi:MAG: hypothetical protein ACUVSQ_04370 [Pseudanabaenaceae cyanobacterium]
MKWWEALVARETPDGRYRFEVCLEGQEALALFQVWDTVAAQTWWGWVLAVNLFENGEGVERWGQWVNLLQEARDRRLGRYREWGTVPVSPQVTLPFVLEALPTAEALPTEGWSAHQAAAVALDVALAVAQYHEGLLVRNWTGQIVGRRVLAHGNLEPAHVYWTGDRPVLSGGGLRAAWAELRTVELAPLVGDGSTPEREDDVQAIGRLLAKLTDDRAPAPLRTLQNRAIAGEYPHVMALAAALRAVVPKLQPWYERWRQKGWQGLQTPWWLVPLTALAAAGLARRSVPTWPERPPLVIPEPVAREPRVRPPSAVRFVPLPPKPSPPAIAVAPAAPSPPPVAVVSPPLPSTPPVSQRPIAVISPPPPPLPPVRPAVPLLPAVETVNGDTIEVILTAETSPSLHSLWQSAEAAVGNAVERAFAEGDRSEVRVLAIAERNRQRIPVLVTQVRRQDWQANLDVRPQSRYLSAAAPLLGFGGPTRPATVAPAIALPAQSPAQRPPTLVPGRSRRAPAVDPPTAPTPTLGIPTAPKSDPSPPSSDTR